MNKKYDVAVAWRIYPKISKHPIIFSDNKFELVSVCLKSFKLSTSNLKIKYFFLLDGCPSTYVDLINQIFHNDDFEIIELNSIGNLATFKLQIDLLSEQNYSDVVYFAEDDYLYQPGEFHKMVSLINQKEMVHFASCYLHKDTFTHPIHNHKKETFEFEKHHWLTESSTCLTFITKKETLIATKDIFYTYTKGNNDCAMWLVLTKTFIYNPLKYLYFYFTHRESFNILKVAVKYSFKYFFNFKKYNLVVANPAIGTHLEKDLTSPGIDWENLAEKINNGEYDNILETKV